MTTGSLLFGILAPLKPTDEALEEGRNTSFGGKQKESLGYSYSELITKRRYKNRKQKTTNGKSNSCSISLISLIPFGVPGSLVIHQRETLQWRNNV
jgi:hypothetical protein